MNQQNTQQKFVKKWNEICKMKEEISSKKRKIMDEMTNENNLLEDIDKKKQKMMDEIMKEMTEKDEENTKLKKDNRAMKLKMAKIEADLKMQNLSIYRRKMPAVELLSELFGTLPFENAFGFLAKMPNGLLARNVQKMINGIKKAMKNNKLNETDCGFKLIISENGLVTKYSGQSADGWNCVRAILLFPTKNLNGIKKTSISFYYEVQILNKSNRDDIVMGFCDKYFQLEKKWLGDENTSIGIFKKRGIWIDGSWIAFGNDNEFFKNGNVVGIGIIHQIN